MYHRMPLVKHPATDHPANHQLMIARRTARLDSAIQKSERLQQHRRGTFVPADLQPRKSVLARLKALAEMADHVRLAVIQNIQREAGAFQEPVSQETVAAHRH